MVGALFGTGDRISSAEASKKAEEALEFVDLLPLKDVPAGDLTLANQKRLEMARALGQRSGTSSARRTDGRPHPDRGGRGHGRRHSSSGTAASR